VDKSEVGLDVIPRAVKPNTGINAYR